MMQLTWRDLLYSERVDEFSDYQKKIPEPLRQQVEKFYGRFWPPSTITPKPYITHNIMRLSSAGTRRVVAALMTRSCSECRARTSLFNVVTCTKACVECWTASTGAKGTDIANAPFALCTKSFAKQARS
jgi:hypothetical protein